ncbi:THO complex subunit 4B-like isoform X2 [Malania oleifera]|uniref:THO complex subunit 4B-like isoform X2 n=1 Tax=Malania oleifera TaxID=397392 RepID=UPI0025ADA60F|nr:THO complex subunit 4B-like isoform X2 [Malania oleifera]
MSGALDMSLDDLIQKNKRSAGYRGGGRSRGSRGGGRSFGSGPTRRFATRPLTRPTPYSLPQEVLRSGSRSSMEADAKLYISNLDYGVSNDDIKVLFSEVGDLKRYSVHYDRSGRSKGTAEVVFSHHTDALAAMKRYNNVQLDGKPMKVELVGVNFVTPAAAPPPTIGILGSPQGTFRRQQMVGNQGWFRGGGSVGPGRGSGRGRGQGTGRGERISAEDLDADLDKYHFEAMQIN